MRTWEILKLYDANRNILVRPTSGKDAGGPYKEMIHWDLSYNLNSDWEIKPERREIWVNDYDHYHQKYMKPHSFWSKETADRADDVGMVKRIKCVRFVEVIE